MTHTRLVLLVLLAPPLGRTLLAQDGAAPAEASPAVPASSDAPAGSLWTGWKSRFEGGLNGSEGNSETLDLRFGLGTKRATPTLETSLDAGYSYATEEGEKSKSRGELSARNDWLSPGSPWGFFATTKAEYDEFQDWDWRLSFSAGPSYAFVKSDRTTLRGRVGAGGSYELGGQNEELTPELVLGADFSHAVSERQKIFANADYLPSLSAFPAYRVDAKAGWEFTIDPATNTFLKLGLAQRYDSTPGLGRDRSDFEYFLTIGWSF